MVRCTIINNYDQLLFNKSPTNSQTTTMTTTMKTMTVTTTVTITITKQPTNNQQTRNCHQQIKYRNNRQTTNKRKTVIKE